MLPRRPSSRLRRGIEKTLASLTKSFNSDVHDSLGFAKIVSVRDSTHLKFDAITSCFRSSCQFALQCWPTVVCSMQFMSVSVYGMPVTNFVSRLRVYGTLSQMVEIRSQLADWTKIDRCRIFDIIIRMAFVWIFQQLQDTGVVVNLHTIQDNFSSVIKCQYRQCQSTVALKVSQQHKTRHLRC